MEKTKTQQILEKLRNGEFIGMKQKEIAKVIKCDNALVSRVFKLYKSEKNKIDKEIRNFKLSNQKLNKKILGIKDEESYLLLKNISNSLINLQKYFENINIEYLLINWKEDLTKRVNIEKLIKWIRIDIEKDFKKVLNSQIKYIFLDNFTEFFEKNISQILRILLKSIKNECSSYIGNIINSFDDIDEIEEHLSLLKNKKNQDIQSVTSLDRISKIINELKENVKDELINFNNIQDSSCSNNQNKIQKQFRQWKDLTDEEKKGFLKNFDILELEDKLGFIIPSEEIKKLNKKQSQRKKSSNITHSEIRDNESDFFDESDLLD